MDRKFDRLFRDLRCNFLDDTAELLRRFVADSFCSRLFDYAIKSGKTEFGFGQDSQARLNLNNILTFERDSLENTHIICLFILRDPSRRQKNRIFRTILGWRRNTRDVEVYLMVM